jgi:hypothetical protein
MSEPFPSSKSLVAAGLPCRIRHNALPSSVGSKLVVTGQQVGAQHATQLAVGERSAEASHE